MDNDWWSLNDRLKYLFFIGAVETEEFLCLKRIYGTERINQAYQELLAEGASYVPKSCANQIHPAPHSKPSQKTPIDQKEYQKGEKKHFSRFHPHEPDDDTDDAF